MQYFIKKKENSILCKGHRQLTECQLKECRKEKACIASSLPLRDRAYFEVVFGRVKCQVDGGKERGDHISGEPSNINLTSHRCCSVDGEAKSLIPSKAWKVTEATYE